MTSGYTPCACRDCMDVSISSDTTAPELCLLCKDAGCEANAGECQREAPTVCEWFALCDHEATGTRAHPVLGLVPICDRCNAKVEALA